MQDGDYPTAVRDFDAFIAAYPKDRRVAKARVLRAMANVRQYVSVSGGTWSTALEAAREMFETLEKRAEFRDERVDLAELVIKIGEGLADRARRAADAKASGGSGIRCSAACPDRRRARAGLLEAFTAAWPAR